MIYKIDARKLEHLFYLEVTYAGRSHPAHRCPLRGGYKALRRDAATGHEKSAGRDAERRDRPQDQAAPRQADPPAADEA